MFSRSRFRRRAYPLALLLGAGALLAVAQSPQPAAAAANGDPLGRLNPRSAVTRFLEACHSDDYAKAAQYLDLHQISIRNRGQQGVALARQLETILNSAARFNVLALSQNPEGNLGDDPNPAIERIATITRNGSDFVLEMERVQLQPSGPQVWLFSPPTVAAIPDLTPATTESSIEARLPGFLVTNQIFETPLWKWIVLLVVAVVVFGLFRLLSHLLLRGFDKAEGRFRPLGRFHWLEAILEPLLVFLSAVLFGIVQEFVSPSALSRLYIGRALLLIIVAAFAWCLINLVEVFLLRVDSLLDPRQRLVSHSLIYLGRRTARVVIGIVAAIIVLENWGFPMTTFIAGLGVGGIAVALAAQQTIANIFGGVSVIGDHPVMVGDFGNFGGVIGTVDDIGMRSTRIRTLGRTIVSVPNSSFAGMNLENYSVRDKILFNPTIQVKRTTPKDQIRHSMTALEDLFKADKRVETGPSPTRISAFSSASFALEIFVYVLTTELDEFYKVEADLFLRIDDVLASSGIELA